MTNRLVVISDEASRKSKYRMVTGEAKVKIILDRTVDSSFSKGYSLVLDKTLPVTSKGTVQIGETSTEVELSVNVASGLDLQISQEQSAILNKILNHGSKYIKNNIETVASAVMAQLLKPGIDRLYLYRIVTIIYPRIFQQTLEELSSALSELHFLEIDLTTFPPNITQQISNYVDQQNALFEDGWRNLIDVQLTTPYDPQTELKSIRNHLEGMRELLPEQTIPTEEDIRTAFKVVEQVRKSNSHNLITGRPRLNPPG